MVRQRNIEPLTPNGLEMANRFAQVVPELNLNEWLQTPPDAAERLHARDRLLYDDHPYAT